MSQKNYLQVTSYLFSVAALVHISRLLMGWSVNVAGFEVPTIASAGMALVASLLAYSAFKLAK